MLDFLRNIYKSPDDNDPSFIRMIRNILVFMLLADAAIVALVSGLVIESARNDLTAIILLVIGGLVLISLLLVRQRKLGMAKLVVPLSIIAASALIAINANGMHDVYMPGFIFAVIAGGLLLGRPASYTITPAAIIAAEIVAYADLNGYTNSPFAVQTDLGDALIAGIIIFASSAALQLLIQRLNASVAKARENEKAQTEANLELQRLRASLEMQVNQRTSELEAANKRNQRRVQQFEAISQVARVITTIQDLELLLPRITELISQHFGFYHVGIFLLDENREYAVLRAANSEGGRKMLANEHKLRVGQTGIVGYVTGSGRPRLALDTGADAVYFNNPDLPLTRSEVALPLNIAGQVIGALDVQSVEPNAFSQDDVQILSTLAAQVAAAIQNARTFEESQKLLHEAQSAVSGFIREAWQVMRPLQRNLGYQFTGSAMKLLGQPLEGPHISEALKKGKMALSGGESPALALPIRLRDQVIGVMELKNPNNQPWNDDQIDIAAAVAERLSLSIEVATLLEATQRRANIERITSDISARLSSSTHFETILQTAAEELSRAFGNSDVLVQIEPVSLKMSSST